MKYRFIDSFTDRHGHARVYFRRSGARIPLPAIESPEFVTAYRAAINGSPLVRPRRERPRGPLIGVYLLMRDGQVIYVGSSLNMPRRVAGHRANGRPFDQVFYIATKADQREALERTLIRQINPKQNRQGRSKWLTDC